MTNTWQESAVRAVCPFLAIWISPLLSWQEKRIHNHYGAEFSYDDDVLVHIVARCQESDTGARNIENILSRSVLPQLATECLTYLGRGETISRIHIGVSEDGSFDYQLS